MVVRPRDNEPDLIGRISEIIEHERLSDDEAVRLIEVAQLAYSYARYDVNRAVIDRLEQEKRRYAPVETRRD